MGLFLVAVGAVLLFAVPDASPFGLNLHVVGIIVIVIGILGLLLPAAVGGRPKRDRLRGWLNPTGINDPAVHDVKSAAETDAMLIQKGEVLFDPDQAESQPGEVGR